MLVIDNGPQYYSAELSAFARSWCFEKVTSSPKLPKYSGSIKRYLNGQNDNGGIWDYSCATVYGTLQQNSVTNSVLPIEETCAQEVKYIQRKLVQRKKQFPTIINSSWLHWRPFNQILCLETTFTPWRKDKSTSTGDRFQVCEQANQ